MKIQGGLLQIIQGWHPVSNVKTDEPWTIESIAKRKSELFANSEPGIPPFLMTQP